MPFMPKSRFPEAVDPAQCALHQPAVTPKVFVWEKLEALINSDPHTLLSVLIFLGEVPERARAETVLERLAVEILRRDFTTKA